MRIFHIMSVCAIAFVEAAHIPKDVRKKPGKCPYVRDTTTRQCPLPPDIQNIAAFNDFLMSIAECLFDGDCKGTDKCCFDGCKTRCTSVIQSKRDKTHAGKCPPPSISRASNCSYADESTSQHECTRDKDCPKNEKCCFDGCLAKCTRVSKHPKMKPGECPPIRTLGAKKCTKTSARDDPLPRQVSEEPRYCYSDDDCKGTAKCCHDGCNLRCFSPRFSKENDSRSIKEGETSSGMQMEANSSTAERKDGTHEVPYIDSLLSGNMLTETPAAPVPKAQDVKIERTFVMIKPDGVRRGLISEVMNRFERKGYKLVALKLLQPTKTLLRKHYSNLYSKSLLQDIREYVGSGPIVAMVWQGTGAVGGAKRILGTAGTLAAAPGTIRFDFSAQAGRDIVHGSDNRKQADKEIQLWFTEKEIFDWDPL